MALSTRYDDALVYAHELHRDQTRKGSGMPYIAHLLSVSALVLEAGGDEDQAIAGLLHDALEDQPEKTDHARLASRFGDRVADLVRACSDAEPLPGQEKPPWKQRKEDYLAHLEEAAPEVLAVSRADKLHNARAILADLRVLGPGIWDRFNADRGRQLWYYESLAGVFARRLPGPQSDELTRTVQAIADQEPPAGASGAGLDSAAARHDRMGP